MKRRLDKFRNLHTQLRDTLAELLPPSLTVTMEQDSLSLSPKSTTLFERALEACADFCFETPTVYYIEISPSLGKKSSMIVPVKTVIYLYILCQHLSRLLPSAAVCLEKGRLFLTLTESIQLPSIQIEEIKGSHRTPSQPLRRNPKTGIPLKKLSELKQKLQQDHQPLKAQSPSRASASETWFDKTNFDAEIKNANTALAALKHIASLLPPLNIEGYRYNEEGLSAEVTGVKNVNTASFILHLHMLIKHAFFIV